MGWEIYWESYKITWTRSTFAGFEWGRRVKIVHYETVWNHEGSDPTFCWETQKFKSLKCQGRRTLSIIAPCPAGVWDRSFPSLTCLLSAGTYKKLIRLCQPCQSRFGIRVLLLDMLLIRAQFALLFTIGWKKNWIHSLPNDYLHVSECN